MKIYGKEKNKRSLTAAGLIVGAIALLASIKQLMSGGSTVLLLLALLILAMAVYKNKTVISEEGYDEIMSLLVFSKHNLWKWEAITFIFADFRKSAPDAVLVVRSGSATKKTIVDPDSVQQIFDWAAEKNEYVRIQYNGDREFNVRGRQKMSEEEYARARGMTNTRPSNFHEMAEEARRVKRELELRKPDPKKLKVKRNSKAISSWNQNRV